jgi:hypothetical protein
LQQHKHCACGRRWQTRRWRVAVATTTAPAAFSRATGLETVVRTARRRGYARPASCHLAPAAGRKPARLRRRPHQRSSTPRAAAPTRAARRSSTAQPKFKGAAAAQAGATYTAARGRWETLAKTVEARTYGASSRSTAPHRRRRRPSTAEARGRGVAATAYAPGGRPRIRLAPAHGAQRTTRTQRANTGRARALRLESTATARGHHARAAAPAAGRRPRLQSAAASHAQLTTPTRSASLATARVLWTAGRTARCRATADRANATPTTTVFEALLPLRAVVDHRDRPEWSRCPKQPAPSTARAPCTVVSTGAAMARRWLI